MGVLTAASFVVLSMLLSMLLRCPTGTSLAGCCGLRSSPLPQVRTVFVHPRYAASLAPVVAAFTANFDEGREAGAQLAVYHKGQLALSLVGGRAGSGGAAPMTEAHRTTIFSSSKPAESLCIALLADRGLLEYDAPVARYWPAFGAHGKGGVTVAQLMRHQGGVFALNETVALADLAEGATQHRFSAFLADQRPLRLAEEAEDEDEDKNEGEGVGAGAGAAGTGQAGGRRPQPWPRRQRRPRRRPRLQLYHAVTRGWFASELVRRVDPRGRSLGAFFHEEVAARVGVETDFTIGRGAAPPGRRAELVGAPLRVVLLQVLPQLLLLAPWQAARDWLVGPFDALTQADVRATLRLARGALKLMGARLARLLRGGGGALGDDADALAFRSLATVLQGLTNPLVANEDAFHAVEIPSVNGLATARAMAAVGMAAIGAAGAAGAGGAGAGAGDAATDDRKDGVVRPLLSAEGLARALAAEGVPRFDEGLCFNVSYSACGWGLDRFAQDGAPGWMGWAGLGGSMFQMDVRRQTSFAYVPTLLYSRMSKPRAMRSLRALHAALETFDKG